MVALLFATENAIRCLRLNEMKYSARPTDDPVWDPDASW